MRTTRFLASMVAALAVCGSPLRAQDSYAISGTIVTEKGIIPHGTVVIVKDTIQSIAPSAVVPEGIPVLEVDGVVFPGLVDLHNHVVWNVLPRWKLPSPVGNRYDWQAMPEYQARLSKPEGELIAKGFGCDMERYAEIKALLGGATSVTGSFGPTKEQPRRNECVRGLARNLDVYSGLYTDQVNAEPLAYEIFPFEMGWQRAQTIRDGLQSGQLRAMVAHVAEGKDASAKREFRMLRGNGFLLSGVTVIHGVALDAADFLEMAGNGVGFLWSPRSNLELYGKTADIAAAKSSKVTMAISPDWSPTGSSGVLDELRYAYQWDSRRDPRLLSAADLLQMATANPARLAGVNTKIGTLAPGMKADLIVLPRRGDSPLQALVDSAPASVQLVIVGGRPLVGDPEPMSKLLPGKPLELKTICGRQKAFNVLGDTEGESLQAIEGRLTVALQSVGSQLAGLSDCE